MKIVIRLLSKTIAETSPGEQRSLSVVNMDSTDVALLAALPVHGDTVLVPYREDANAPEGLGTFVVEARAFTYLEDSIQVDVILAFTGMLPLPKSAS